MPELTFENSADLVGAFVNDDLPHIPSPEFTGRGIVIAAGGMRLFTNAWVAIRMLRRFGCNLPIECWYLGEPERDESWADLASQYGVRCIDAYQVRKEHPHGRLHGWELKPYAITWSRFNEVLFLDADNVPICDPTYLFDTPQYRAHGAVFWPDYNRLGKERDAWKVFGNIEYRDEAEFESGQILINKSRCWQALQLVHWYMQNSNNFYFHFVHGDKEIFHMAWRRLNQPYAMIPHAIEPLIGVMCQHDFEGNRIFQHRNLRKWTLENNPETPGFRYEEECIEYLAELRQNWRPGAAFISKLTSEELLTMSAMAGKAFAYVRLGFDVRTLHLDRHGLIGSGSASRETFWWFRAGILFLAAEDQSITARMIEGPDGVWFGRWDVHEKMPVMLVPVARINSY